MGFFGVTHAELSETKHEKRVCFLPSAGGAVFSAVKGSDGTRTRGELKYAL